jgi:mannose-1-phosphate guanylyltransferase
VIKAMILAAGLGTRLRPLTFECAKPAMPLLGKPIVARLVEQLTDHGVGSFRINLHHMTQSVERIFHSAPWDTLPVSFSHEQEILGTAGGLKANESFFDQGTFLMVNGKIVMDLPLEEALAFHRERHALATLILCPQEPPYRWFPVRIDEEYRLCNFKGAVDGGEPTPQSYVFTGIHIIEPEIFSFIPPGVFYEINDQVYPAAMQSGKRVLGFPVQGYWQEPSNPGRYLEAQRDLFLRSGKAQTVHIPTDAIIDQRASVGPFVSMGSGCVLDGPCSLENAILWDNVHVKSGAVIRNSVLGSAVTIEGQCVDKVVTRNGEAPVV